MEYANGGFVGPDQDRLDRARALSAAVRDNLLATEIRLLRKAIEDKGWRIERWREMFGMAVGQRDAYRTALEAANDAIERLLSELETARHERDLYRDGLV